MLEDGGLPGYRQGLISRVSALVAAHDTNHTGDLVALFGNYVKTYLQADAMPGPTEFYDLFLGVLTEGASEVPEPADAPCTVYTQGQMLYPLDAPASRYWPVGTFVTMAGDQVVTLDASANLSTMVGKVCVPVEIGDREVLFELRSKVMS